MINLNGSILSPRTRDKSTLTGFGAQVDGVLMLCWAQVTGSLDLAELSTPTIVDNPIAWPEQFNIGGLRYDRIESVPPRLTPRVELEDRKAWLQHQTPFDLDPYQVLAADYRRQGLRRQAQAVLISGLRKARRANVDAATGWRKIGAWAVRVSLWVIDTVTGYGYRPQRAAAALLVLVMSVFVLVSIPQYQEVMRTSDPTGRVFDPGGVHVDTPAASLPSHASLPSCGSGAVRCFRPLEFAIDTAVPLVSFGQGSTWYPDDESANGRTLSWILLGVRALGWLLATVCALSIARVLRD